MQTAPYLTSNRFAAVGGFGIDTSFLKGPQLRANLQRATAMVNTWCNGSQLPQPFDFRGGTVTDEQHQFPMPDPLVMFPGSRRVFVNQRPLRELTAFSIQFTTTYQITLPMSNLFVNTSQGWCEIIASQPTIIGYPPIGYWFGLYQPIAKVSYTYGYRNAIAGDVCEAATPTQYFASYGAWDPTVAPVVQIDGSTVSSSLYKVNAADGSITFRTAPAAGTEVTADYTATLPDAIAQATGLIAVDLIGKSRNAARMPGLSSMKVAEISITRLTGDRGRYVTKNGISIPEDAAALLGGFALGSAA